MSQPRVWLQGSVRTHLTHLLPRRPRAPPLSPSQGQGWVPKSWTAGGALARACEDVTTGYKSTGRSGTGRQIDLKVPRAGCSEGSAVPPGREPASLSQRLEGSEAQPHECPIKGGKQLLGSAACCPEGKRR